MRSNLPTKYALSSKTRLPGFDDGGAAAGAGEGGSAVTLAQVQDLIKKAVPDVNTIVNNAIGNLKKKDLPEIIKTELAPFGTQLTGITSILEALKPGQGAGAGSGTGGTGDGGKPTIPPEVNAEMKRMGEQLASTQTALKQLQVDKDAAEKRAETTDRHGKIRTALSSIEYAGPNAVETAFAIVEPQVRKLDDGTLVGGDNLPLVDWLKDYMPKEHGYLLKPTGASGAGASGGSGGSRSAGVVTTDMIKPGMTQAERAAVTARIAEVAGAGR